MLPPTQRPAPEIAWRFMNFFTLFDMRPMGTPHPSECWLVGEPKLPSPQALVTQDKLAGPVVDGPEAEAV